MSAVDKQPVEVRDLVHAVTVANDAMKTASAELMRRSTQVEVALDSLLMIVEGKEGPREIAAKAILEMRRLQNS